MRAPHPSELPLDELKQQPAIGALRPFTGCHGETISISISVEEWMLPYAKNCVRLSDGGQVLRFGFAQKRLEDFPAGQGWLYWQDSGGLASRRCFVNRLR